MTEKVHAHYSGQATVPLDLAKPLRGVAIEESGDKASDKPSDNVSASDKRSDNDCVPSIERRLSSIGGLNRVKQVIDLFASRESVTTAEVSKVLELSHTRTREVLREMTSMSILKKHGDKRHTRYTLAEDGE
jgi:predicted HTH transcriptional regulator